ncbi:MAG: SWIM zinc finger family protein [Chloroflexi bacterium]|nr:SWIM zinc finger family protein [Chloroflexota bacterium]
MSYDYEYFRPTKPVETDKGLKAHSKRGEFVKNWWAERWIKALEQLVDAGRLRRGRSYARSGQVLSIEEKKDGLLATVQGSRATPYKVTIQLQPLTEMQWDAVIDTLAERAIFTAQLLAGEMPQAIEEAFATAGVSLFPAIRVDLVTTCTCPDPANPCKHAAATYYILGEQFDEDPFLLFRLRGRSQEQIIEALRARRSTGEPVQLAEAGVDYGPDATPTQLEETLAHFWDVGQGIAQFPTNIKPPLTPHPVLQRLGQPAFLDENLDQWLGPAYDAIMNAALKATFAETEEPATERT